MYENTLEMKSNPKKASGELILLILTIIFEHLQKNTNQSNTKGVTSGAGTAYPSGTPEFTPVFSGVRVPQSLVFSVMFCRSLFVFSGVRVPQSLVFSVMFCRSLFVLLFFFFCHCAVNN